MSSAPDFVAGFGLDEFDNRWNSNDEFLKAARESLAVRQFIQMRLPNNHVAHVDGELTSYLEEVGEASVETLMAVL